jgi:hypothetical protein
MKEKDLYKSYNCFYSAVYSQIEKYYLEYSQLIINNRWQMFYRLGENYSHDFRRLGEYPLLFDSEHLENINQALHINITIEPGLKGITDIIKRIHKDGYALVFANRFYYKNILHHKNDKSVTTIMLDKYCGGLYHYHVFDNDLIGNCWMDEKIVNKSWIHASEIDMLKKALINLKIDISDLIHDKKTIFQLFQKCMTESLTTYLEGGSSGQYIFGNKVFSCFINYFENWTEDFKDLVDISMYVNLVIKQRKFISHSLSYLKEHNILTDYGEEKLEQLINNWDRLKIIIYIMGIRQQVNSLHPLKELIKDIQYQEYQYTKSLLSKLQKLYLE